MYTTSEIVCYLTREYHIFQVRERKDKRPETRVVLWSLFFLGTAKKSTVQRVVHSSALDLEVPFVLLLKYWKRSLNTDVVTTSRHCRFPSDSN